MSIARGPRAYRANSYSEIGSVASSLDDLSSSVMTPSSRLSPGGEPPTSLLRLGGQRPGDVLALQFLVASGVGTDASWIRHAARQQVAVEASGGVDGRHGGRLKRALREGVGRVAIRWHQRRP